MNLQLPRSFCVICLRFSATGKKLEGGHGDPPVGRTRGKSYNRPKNPVVIRTGPINWFYVGLEYYFDAN